ncbi:MAG TPA: acyl-CoA dehydrogenase family protein [Aquabacterium sp.]|uniref:acyl-CoA dehydrogenase family protein n=1 Tax=Aquabacterium sp. TaxID=1872578 RepID=UPI002E2F6F5E|nr:acyl-CoA dehydrogenase family protein [Aquabacterium sp.]HEX5374255.1 acyl-CoA dehydrogenase family protein [Aquabacterium sp.]
MSTLEHLEGHVSPLHALNPLLRIGELNALGRTLTHYRPADLWDMDTASLPAALGHLRRRVRHFAQTHMAPHVRLLDETEHPAPGTLHPVARQLLIEAGREGLMANTVPAPMGSASLWDLRFSPAYRMAIQVEEMAAVCAGQMLLLSAHHLGLAPVLLSGDVKAMWRFIRPMHLDFQQGRPHLFAYAITEPTAGSDVEDGHGAMTNRPRVVAKAVPGGFRISGQKCYISGGDVARKVAVFAALEGEGFESWTCFMVDASNPGMHARRTELKMGMRASSAAELTLDDAFVPDADVIGGLRKGWALNRATLNASRYPVAAMAVGIARRACELALVHAMDTRLGGRHLLSYQEVQLQLAQMVAETRAIRSLLWQHASGGMQPRQSGACISKFLATDRAQAICEMGMNLMAEQGARQGAGMEKLLRDIRLTRIFEGTNQINRLGLIEDMQPLLLARMAGEPIHISV